MAWEKLSRRTSVLSLSVLSLLWIALVIAGARLTSFDEPYLPFAIAGAVAFFLRGAPERSEIYALLLSAALLVKVIHLPQVPFWILRVAASVALLGFAAILLLGLRAIWSERESRQNALSLLAPALILIFFIYGCARVLSLTSGLSPLTYDAWLYAFDGSLGFQPSFALGRIMYNSIALTGSALLIYLSLPFAMGVVCAWNIPAAARRMSWHMLAVILFAGAGGWLLYNVVPGTGPIYAFAQDFPWKNLSYHELANFPLRGLPVPTSIPRNAMPSLHVAWALLLYWNSRRFPLGLRIYVLIFFIFTVIATMGSGQHYFVDLVVSLPFAVAVQSLAWFLLPERSLSGNLRNLIAVIAGFSLTMSWLMLVRYGVPLVLKSPAIPWTLILATFAGTLWIKRWASAGDGGSLEQIAGSVDSSEGEPVATEATV